MSGILEKILANQEQIKSQLNQIAAAMGKTPTDTQPSSATAVTEQVTSTETPPAQDASVAEPKTGTVKLDVELDSDGVPWDKRIHSGKNASEGKRTKDGKGVWQKRRGVDKAEYERITAELKAKYATASEIGSATDTPPPPTPAADTPPLPNTPPVPGSETPPPPADNPTEASRKKANEAMHKLTKELGVNLDVIIMYFQEAYDVDNFSLIPAEKYDELADTLQNWGARLETADGTINWIKRIYQSDPSAIQPHIDHIIGQFQYVSCGETETATTIGEVPENMVSQLNEGLNALLEQCRKLSGQ